MRLDACDPCPVHAATSKQPIAANVALWPRLPLLRDQRMVLITRRSASERRPSNVSCNRHDRTALKNRRPRLDVDYFSFEKSIDLVRSSHYGAFALFLDLETVSAANGRAPSAASMSTGSRGCLVLCGLSLPAVNVVRR